MFTRISNGGSGLVLSADHRFDTVAERDAWFVANPSDLYDGVLVTVAGSFKMWNTSSSLWEDSAIVVEGPVGPMGPQGVAGVQGAQGVQGIKGDKGDTGDTGMGFSIGKLYSSVAALTADTNPIGILVGQFALIDTVDPDDPDNSKLYLWRGTDNSGYLYVGDLSGATGITGPKGDKGDTGDTGSTGPQGIQGIQGVKGDRGPAGVGGLNGVDTFTLEAQDIANKYVDLTRTISCDLQSVVVLGGSSVDLQYLTDYVIISDSLDRIRRVSWNTYALDGFLSVGDVLKIRYAYES